MINLGTIIPKIHDEDQTLDNSGFGSCSKGLIALLFQPFGLIWGPFEYLGGENRKHNKNSTECISRGFFTLIPPRNMKSLAIGVRPLFAALKAAVGVFSLGVLKAHTY